MAPNLRSRSHTFVIRLNGPVITALRMQLTRSGGVRAALMNFRNISPGLFLNSADGVVWYLYLLIFIQILPLENMRILQQSHCDKCEGFDLSLKGIKQLYWEYLFWMTPPSSHAGFCLSGCCSLSHVPSIETNQTREGRAKSHYH